jgi:methionyl-tRNA formyltransferase
MLRVVWEMPELGTFNLHASLLPNYRAAPIMGNNGETTGVTTFLMMILVRLVDDLVQNAGFDVCRTPTQHETVINTLELIEGNVITTIQKDASEIKSAFKLNKENCRLDKISFGN